jgi:hypothetical protein
MGDWNSQGRKTDRDPIRFEHGKEIKAAIKDGNDQVKTQPKDEMDGYLGVDDLDRLRRLRLGKQTNYGKDSR